MLWFIKLSLVLQQSPATMRSCNESYALLGVLQPPATMTVPDKLIKQRVWDREMPAVGRARREQLNAVPQPPADKEQKPALLLPTVPKLLCSPGTWQDAVFLLSPWHFAQLKGVSAFWRPLPGTQSPVWMSSWKLWIQNPWIPNKPHSWNIGLWLKSPGRVLTADQKDTHPLRPSITSPADWFIGKNTWRWRQVRLKAESPSAVKA